MSVPFSNFIIVADVRSRGAAALESAVSRMGTTCRINPLVTLLHTDRTAGSIRNDLIQLLGTSDNLLVIDANHGKLAWFNLGPEIDAKLRALWKTPKEP